MTLPPEDEILPSGSVIADRYVIEDRIGEGGMGIVYRARQSSLERSVALKVILSRYAAIKGARYRFAREAKVSSALKHANAVEVYDFGDFRNTLYLAMELLDGTSLRSFVDEHKPPLSVRRAAQIAADVADVLIAASVIGLVHRDLKPENIFLDHSRGMERVVVLDFGLAFMREEGSRGRITQDGVITGTPDYMSPEQARGVEVTPASDVYSLGCVLYEMLTAFPPFSGEASVVVAKHLFGGYQPLRHRRPQADIPAALEELVQRMLAKAPSERPNARNVRDALRKIAEDRPERKVDSPSDSSLLGREARMVSEPPGSMQANAKTQQQARESRGHLVAWIALEPIPIEAALALEMGGFRYQQIASPSELQGSAASVIFLPDASETLVSELVNLGIPVVAQTHSSEINGLTRLLRAGAADVVIAPYEVDELLRKLARCARKAR